MVTVHQFVHLLLHPRLPDRLTAPPNPAAFLPAGILSVTATDKGTGKKQDIKITGASTLPSDEVERMVKDAEKNAEGKLPARSPPACMQLARRAAQRARI